MVVGKEIFGGSGFNILNPALTARAFLFFAYPSDLSGDRIWIAADTAPDAVSGATWLARLSLIGPEALQETFHPAGGAGISAWDAFIGLLPGSMGETSVLACLFGALVLVATGIGSLRDHAGGGGRDLRSGRPPEPDRFGYQSVFRDAVLVALPCWAGGPSAPCSWPPSR